MDSKTWLWRKRSSEKIIIAATTSDTSSKGNEEEMLPTEKEVNLERALGNLNENLASVLCELNAKDELLAQHAKMAEEANTDREKAEAEAVALKQELDKALEQKTDSNERLTQLNAALKESMQQLTSVREEQDQRIRDAVMKTSTELEKAQKKLEDKLTEKSKRLSNLTVENTRMSKTLLVNQKLIEDLSEHKYQAEAEFNALMARLDSVEKENAFLKYEFRMLEKELEMRNEESDFNRQSADVSHKQYMDSLKKNAKLETECQRLRILVRKRFPGPAALTKMKSEVEVVRRNQPDMRRKNPNLTMGSLVSRESSSSLQNPNGIPNKISFLIDHLCDLEEENKTLKEVIAKKDDDLHFSEIVCNQTASKLSKIEAQLEKLSEGQKPMEITNSESWATALISEPENFRDRSPKTPHECKSFGVSDMSLMDDFAEMEKLAIVTVGTPLGSSCASSDANNALALSLENSVGYDVDSRGKELVPVEQGQSNYNEREIQTNGVSSQEGYDWLQNVLNLILDQTRISKRSSDDLLEDIKTALTYMKHSCASEESLKVPISGYITWKSPTVCPVVGLPNGVTQDVSSVREEIRRLGSGKSPSASELEGRVDGPFSESNGEKVRSEINLRKEYGLKDEFKNMESLRKEYEARLSLENEKSEALMNQLQESERNLEDLKTELIFLKESKGIMVDQIEHQKLINEELDTQLTVAKAKLNEVVQKFSSLEVELDDKSHCCEELETTCLELQLQLESVNNNEVPKDCVDQEERLLQTGWEITTASAKLAECQETILSLGKQLKALSLPRDSTNTTAAAAINKMTLSQRPSLRDQMLAEDGAKAKDPNYPEAQEILSPIEAKKPSPLLSNDALSLAIVPSKKKGGGMGFLRKLLLRRKRGNSKKTSRSFAA